MNKLLKQAFTLIELLVVIAIIGILSGLIVVSIGGMTQKATIAKSQVFSSSLRNALMLNLLAEYKFDGETINANDSWSTNNGTVTGTTKINSGCISGSCLSFDGDDDWVSLGSQFFFDSTQPWSFEHWLKWDMTNRSDIIIFYAGSGSTNQNFLIRHDSNNRFGFRSDDSTYHRFPVNSSDLCLDRWTHLVWLADGNGNLFLYINGSLLGNLGSPVAINTSVELYSVGRGYSSRSYTTYPGNTYYYKGLIDEVRIYNSAITLSQIKEQYYSGLRKLLANEGITMEEYQDRMSELATNF
ncbi:prepilin-type N-terminal cleavage/methylation domain-containing protein [bacterium]|jgi:prepilin-type N-terminal cleavage/methylation domain-containing protein|nr:prepilin-type N-terminal cleavage/methylation domain-containing protein [bacterium]